MKMMSKLLFLLILLGSLITGKASGQTIIYDISNETADNVYKEIRKLPDNSKVAVVFFSYDDGFSDTLQTYLGIEFTKQFVHELRAKIQSRNRISQKIFFPENIDDKLNETMSNFFTMPDSEDSYRYWSDWLDQQKPDYYLTASYKIIGDYDEVLIQKITLRPDIYAGGDDIMAVDNVSVKVRDEPDKALLKSRNMQIIDISETYSAFIGWETNTNLFDLKIKESNGKTVDNFKISINKDYRIELNLKKDAWLYAFYYDPNDDHEKYISMIYPYSENLSTFTYAGKASIPPNAVFSPDPPAGGQIYIKIIASEEEIPLTFAASVNSAGYYDSRMDDAACLKLLSELNKVAKNKISEKSITLTRVK